MTQYVYYATDESFDYWGPFGSETQHEIGLHGFSIEFDKDDYPLLETLEFMGDIGEGKESDINAMEKFKKFVEDNMQYARSDTYCTSDEVWDELFEFIDEAIKKEKYKNVKCCA